MRPIDSNALRSLKRLLHRLVKLDTFLFKWDHKVKHYCLNLSIMRFLLVESNETVIEVLLIDRQKATL